MNEETELRELLVALLKSPLGRELLVEFDRLRGTNLSMKGTTLELQIDQASGRVGT